MLAALGKGKNFMSVNFTEEQWEALRNYIKEEALYQAAERFNCNDCADSLRRTRYEEMAKEELVL